VGDLGGRPPRSTRPAKDTAKPPDLFTARTYGKFQKAGAKVSGCRERQLHTCEQVQPGDKLLCYITGISRWVGVLRVTKPLYRIWDMDVFPVRLGVEAEILLPPEHGIPHQLLATITPGPGVPRLLMPDRYRFAEGSAFGFCSSRPHLTWGDGTANDGASGGSLRSHFRVPSSPFTHRGSGELKERNGSP